MDELPADRFSDVSLVTELAVSPDGDRVAFVADEFDPGEDERPRSLFVAPADGSDDPYRLTRASSASQPTWSPDGSRLGFVAARDEDVERTVGRSEEADDGDADDDADDGEDEGAGDADDEGDDGNDGTGGDGPSPQVWAFDLTRGGDARQLTDREEGVADFDWAPDGHRIVVAARDPTDDEADYLRARRDENAPIETERLQHKLNGAGWLDDVTTYLFVVDPSTGEERRLDDAYAAGAHAGLYGMQPQWGDRGILFLANHTDDPDDSGVMDVFLADPEDGAVERLTPSDQRANQPRWSPDGTRVAYVDGHPRNWYVPTEAHVVDVESGEKHSVSASLDRTMAWAGCAEWVDDDTLVGPVADEGQSRLVRFDARRDAPERVFEGLGEYRGVQLYDHAGGTLGMVLSHPGDGRDVFTLDVDSVDDPTDDALVRVSDVNADLVDDTPLPECERVVYENGDGEEIEAVCYLPANFDPEEDDPAPVVVKVHGGPMSYDEPEFSFQYAYWTTRGYVVLKPNYRGSTSYGREFAESLRGSRGDLETDDVVSGVEYLADEGWVDPDRAFLTGFSYGGITTAHAITRTDRFAAAAAEHGIYDFFSTFGTDDNHLWHEDEFGLPWENVETYREISSITDVGEIDTPLLVTAGENDWRCPPTQAEQLYVSVKKQGVPAKLVVYPGEHHNVGKPKRAIHRFETLSEWFSAHDPGIER